MSRGRNRFCAFARPGRRNEGRSDPGGESARFNAEGRLAASNRHIEPKASLRCRLPIWLCSAGQIRGLSGGSAAVEPELAIRTLFGPEQDLGAIALHQSQAIHNLRPVRRHRCGIEMSFHGSASFNRVTFTNRPIDLTVSLQRNLAILRSFSTSLPVIV